jgi:hypothetical protein
VDFSGAAYRELDGEAELVDGAIVLPTPGHSPGLQSLVAPWVERLEAFDPARVVFAHDGAVWEP